MFERFQDSQTKIAVLFDFDLILGLPTYYIRMYFKQRSQFTIRIRDVGKSALIAARVESVSSLRQKR
jgi:hypothetical protein